MNNDTNSLAHTTWNCKYRIVFAPKYIYDEIIERFALFLENII